MRNDQWDLEFGRTGRDERETAVLGHLRCERSAAASAHGRKENRHFDVEELGQRSVDCTNGGCGSLFDLEHGRGGREQGKTMNAVMLVDLGDFH
jgi:hypothetical protein